MYAYILTNICFNKYLFHHLRLRWYNKFKCFPLDGGNGHSLTQAETWLNNLSHLSLIHI